MVRWSSGPHFWTSLCCMTVRTGQPGVSLVRAEGSASARGCPGAQRHTEQLLLQGCAAACVHFLSQSTSVLPGIPAVWGVPLLRYSSLEVCCEEGQTSPASRSQLYLHSSKNKEKCSRAQSFSTQPVRILKRRGDKPPRASFPLQLLSNLFSCLFKCFALGNWGSFHQGFKGISWAHRAVRQDQICQTLQSATENLSIFNEVSLWSDSAALILSWTLCQMVRSVWDLCKIDICLLPCVRWLWGGKHCSDGLCVACTAFICNVNRDGTSLTFLLAQEGLACCRGSPVPYCSGHQGHR